MFFEDELGFRPSRWLRNEQLDMFLDDNCITVQPLEELIVRQTGLHLSMIRLIAAAVLTVPLGFLHRVVPSALGALPCVSSGCQTCMCTCAQLCAFAVVSGTRHGAMRLTNRWWLYRSCRAAPRMTSCMLRNRCAPAAIFCCLRSCHARAL